MRPRFTGSIFKRGDVYWIQYYAGSRRVRESTRGTSIKKAEKLLQKRMGEIQNDTFILEAGRIRVAELVEDVIQQNRVDGNKSLVWDERRWRLHLERFFGHVKASQVSTALIRRYVDERQQAGAENGTITRELALIRAAFRLAAKSTPPKVTRVPYFGMPAEPKQPRKGFLRDDA